MGYGSNFVYHHVKQAVVRKKNEGTKEYLKLCRDIGASGIKVKANALLKEGSKEKTIAQIASSLNEVGKYAGDIGQKIRVEVHGKQTQEIPNMKAVFEQVTEKKCDGIVTSKTCYPQCWIQFQSSEEVVWRYGSYS